MSTPLICAVTANPRIAPSTMRKIAVPRLMAPSSRTSEDYVWPYPVSPLNDFLPAETSGSAGGGLQERGRKVDQAGTELLAEAFGLRVGAGGGGDALAEQADDHEVDRQQVRE